MGKIPFRKLPLEERRKYKAQKERERYARLHPGTNLEQNPLEDNLKGEISKLSEVIAQQSAEILSLREKTREAQSNQSIEDIDSCCKNIDLCLKRYTTLKHSLYIEEKGLVMPDREPSIGDIFAREYPGERVDYKFMAPRLSELELFILAGFQNTDIYSEDCQIQWRDFWEAFHEAGYKDLAALTEREALDVALESVARTLSRGTHLLVGQIIRRNPNKTLPTLSPEQRTEVCKPL